METTIVYWSCIGIMETLIRVNNKSKNDRNDSSNISSNSNTD